jgi:hypothetical protein
MKLSLSWPQEFLSGEKPVAETVEALTFAGVEVEGVEQRGADFDQVIVAHRMEDQAEQLSKPWRPMMLATSSIFCPRINAGPGNTAQWRSVPSLILTGQRSRATVFWLI